MVVEINADDCTGCQVCVDTCPNGVLAIENDVSVVENPEDCDDCGSCMEACPMEAIVDAS